MNITPIILNNRFEYKKRPGNIYPLPPIIGQQNFDSVSFGAIGKTGLKGFNLACANIYKAPLEKFNNVEDLEKWAKTKLEQKIGECEQWETDDLNRSLRYENMLNWKNILTQEKPYKDNSPLSLIIFDSITSGLNLKFWDQPPILDKKILKETVKQIEKQFIKNQKQAFNFSKEYTMNIRNSILIKELGSDFQNKSSWLKIASEQNDPKNFENNLRKLRILSPKSWCTSACLGELYLKKGDFFIFIEKGKTKVAIRIEGNEIAEIQSELNNKRIPIDYIHNIKECIEKRKLEPGKELYNIKNALKNKPFIDEQRTKLKGKTAKEVLESYNLNVALKDGEIKIPPVALTYKGIYWEDLGVRSQDIQKELISQSKPFLKDKSLSEIINLFNLKIDKEGTVKAPVGTWNQLGLDENQIISEIKKQTNAA